MGRDRRRNRHDSLNHKPIRSVREKWYELSRSRFQSRLEAMQRYRQYFRGFSFPPATRNLNVFAESISAAWEFLLSSLCTVERRWLHLGVQSGHDGRCSTFVWHVQWSLGKMTCLRRVVSDSSCWLCARALHRGLPIPRRVLPAC